MLTKRLLAVACCALLGSAVLVAAKGGRTLPSGTWGGEHVALEVSSKGATLEFDCAHGDITQAIRPDTHGRFSVSGTFAAEHGGPVLRDEKPSSSPARYSGQVKGDTMNLTVTRGKEKLGTYKLKRDEAPKLMKCR